MRVLSVLTAAAHAHDYAAATERVLASPPQPKRRELRDRKPLRKRSSEPPRHEIWKGDFLGTSGLFSVEHGRLQQRPHAKRQEPAAIAFFVTNSMR